MKTIIRSVWVVLVLSGVAALAQGRQLVKTPSQTWPLLSAIPPANQITGTCAVSHFAAVTRPIRAAGTEAPHGSVFSVPACPWVNGAFGDISALAGVMNPTSLNDLGTYTITCTDIIVGVADPNNCVTGGICGPLGRACLNQPGAAVYESRSVTIEVYNNLPTLSASLSGTSLISGTTFAHDANVTLTSGASDPDGPVTVRWRIISQPPGSRATLASATGQTTSIQFNGESNFGNWVFEAIAVDAQGETSLPQQLSLTVANRTPHPTISGSPRVRVRSDISLMLSPDEDGGDYTAVQWEALPPGGSWGAVMGTGLTLTIPTTRSSLGTWRFRARVTDNETPALSGMSDEFTVEVYNERPVVMAGGPPRIRVGQSFALTSTATDPDGGPVTVRWIVIQVPNAAPARATLGTPAATYPAATHPGTWVFRAQGEDDEGATENSNPVAVVVDADPIAAIEGGPTITVRAPFDVRDLSYDPDSECPPSAMASDPFGCHSVAMGETFTPLSPGLTNWTWYVDSVPAGYELFHPPGRIGEAFPSVHSGYGRVLHVDEGQMPFGTYTLRVDVRDAEGNPPRSATVQLRVLAPMVPPIAHINLPQRYLLDGSRRLLNPVVLDGSRSFDLDNALSDLVLPAGGTGISSYAWVVTPPSGCSMPTVLGSGQVYSPFAADMALPDDGCIGVWNVTLRVLDDDLPQMSDVRSQDFVIGRCAGEVCIDRPTHERPQLVDTASPVDVPIYYYVEPAVYARYPGGFYGVVDVLPTGSSTPIYTLYDSTISMRPPGTLNLVHWHGERSAGGLAASGTYDVRVRISDLSGLGFGPSSDVAAQAILFEDVHVNVAATSTSYSRYEDLEAGMNRPGFDWTISGAIGVDAVRMEIKRLGAGTAFTNTTSTTRTSGRFEWNGQTSTGTLLPPGAYEVRISALRGTRVLATSTPWSLTVYRLRLGPTAPGAIAVGVNDDDDNLNLVVDRTELNVTGENDLAEVTVSVEPPTMAGTLSVGPADGATNVALFVGPTKTAAAPTSVPWPGAGSPNLYVEGRTPGRGALVLTFTPPTGPALTEARREVNVTGVEIVGALGVPAPSLVPGLIETGATGFGDDVDLHNTPGATFVDEDPSRFVVRVTDAAANLDPMVRERVSASVGTLVHWPLNAGEPERFADDLTVVELLETGVDTGVFESESQLLTNADEQTEPDDEFRLHSVLVGGNVADESPNDRTHRIGAPTTTSFISGGVRAQYGMMRPATDTVPVCGRGPGDRIAVMVRPRTVMEPFTHVPGTSFSYTDPSGFSFNDLNGDHVHQPNEESDPYIDLSTGGLMMLPGGPMSVTAGRSGRGPAMTQAQFDEILHHANEAWAPACLEVRATGPLAVLDSPSLIGPSGLVNDGVITMSTERISFFDLFNGALGPFLPGTIDVVLGFSLCESSPGSPSGCFAYTDSPAYASWTTGPVLVFHGTRLMPNKRILAHELGHGMSNGDSDSPANPPWHFYPAGVTRPDDHYRYRHFPSLIGTQVRTPRPSPTLPGNAFIQSF
ncbi:MAG: hypothetical protein ACOZQL_25415 [Myxococcota bacterium]